MSVSARPDPSTIELTLDGTVATITLNRPAQLNAYTPGMGMAIVDAMDRLDADDRIRAVIVTGAGRAFCAGADIGDGTGIFERGGPDGFRMDRDADTAGALARRFLASPKPIITAYNGAAIGVGFTSTLATDIRIAARSASFGLPFLRLGLVPEGASSWLLPRIVGMTRAQEWVLSGRTFGAEEAFAAGALTQIVDDTDLLPTAMEFARSISARNSPVATALTKRMMWDMFEHGDARTAHELDSLGIFTLGLSPEAAEGIAAWREKRPPDFPLSVSKDLPDYHTRWNATRSTDGLLGEK